MQSSYYEASVARGPARKPLTGHDEAAVAVIGGGYAGLTTALGLAERGHGPVVLIEAERVGFGASGRNGGFVFSGYSLGEDSVLAQVGVDAARRVFARTVAAVDLIRERVRRYAIDCELEDSGVIWANWFRDPQVLLRRQRRMAETFGQHWELLDRDALRARVHSERYHGALLESNAFHLHPLKYALGLAHAAEAQGVRIHENSRCLSLQREGAQIRIGTAEGGIRVRNVVLACGGYRSPLYPRAFRSVLPIATYVMATEPLGERLTQAMSTRAAVYDTRFAFDYYRPLRDTRLLWGGRISILDRPPQAVARLLQRDLAKVFPALSDARIEFAWSGLMSYARHQMPQILQAEPGVWIAQGFGGHGLATTTVAGELLASAIAGDDADWQEYRRWGLERTHGWMGLLAAQSTYWALQAADAWRDWRGG